MGPDPVTTEPRATFVVIGLGLAATVFAFARRESNAWQAWWSSFRDSRRKVLARIEDERWAEVQAELERLQREIDTLRRDQAARDVLIRRHFAWDHQMILLASRNGLGDQIPDVPPLFPSI